MTPHTDHIHPEFHRMLGREDKEKLLGQRGCVLWLYGLSGSGKSTLANALERRLHAGGIHTKLLDGDNVRTGLNRGLGFSDEDRRENIRRVAEVAKLFLHAGVVTIASFITPKRELRDMARAIVGEADFHEVFVKCSFEKCAARDVKGLYAKAEAGQVTRFTGVDSEFEEPEAPDLVIDSETGSIDDSCDRLYEFVSPLLKLLQK